MTASDAPLISAIRNARIRGRDGAWMIGLDGDGMIALIRPDTGATLAADESVVDAAGCLVLPPLIDIHVHLDLAYSYDHVAPNVSGTLVEAIHHWSEAKKTLSVENVFERAVRAVHDEVGFGVGRIRTHVDVGTAAEMRLCEGVLQAREATRHVCDLEVVAFPQDGVIRDPGAVDQIRSAMRLGCDVVGGIAHHERTAVDSRKHIEQLFELAEEFDASIDCHIDETDDPYSHCTEVLAAKTIEHGWQGRVTASHVCALSSYDDVHAAKVIRLLKEAGVHVVTNPAVNLHLQGRFDRYPKRRGLTRVVELLAAGVNVSAGQDCIRDPFYPLGTGNMLEIGHMLVHADHLSAPDQMDTVMDCITVHAASAMRLDDYGIDVGKPADMIVLDVDSVHEALRCHRRPTYVIRRGRRISL